MRILLRDGATRRYGPEMYRLLTDLRYAGIPAAGAARVGERDVILFDQMEHAERAIEMLAERGIVAELD